MTEIKSPDPRVAPRQVTYQQVYAPVHALISGARRRFGLDSTGPGAMVVSCFGLSGLKYGNPAGSNRRGLPHVGLAIIRANARPEPLMSGLGGMRTFSCAAHVRRRYDANR